MNTSTGWRRLRRQAARRGDGLAPAIVMAAAALVLLPVAATAGNWMRSEGETRVGVDLTLSSAGARWDRERDLVRDPCRTQRQSLGLNAEYGYSYHYTVFGSAAVDNESCTGRPGEGGLTDLSLGLRGRLNPFRNGRSWEVSIKLPTDDRESSTRRSSAGVGVSAGVHLRLADDPYADPLEVVRGSLWSWGAGVRLGNSNRGRQLWAYGGWERKLDDSPWRVDARLDGALSLQRADAGDPGPLNDYDKLALALRLSHDIDLQAGWSLSLEQTLWGRNVDRSTALRVGWARRWR